MFLRAFLLTLCVVTGHMEPIGWPFTHCRPELGNSYPCHLWDHLAFQGCWLEGSLPGGEGTLPIDGCGCATSLDDPPEFMLTPLSMMDVEYDLWRQGIPFAGRVTDELDCKEFNDTRLMPSLTAVVCVIPFLIFFSFIFALFDIQVEPLCQASPIDGAPIDSFRLPWSIYTYGPDGSARERAVGRNTKFMGYPFPKGTQAVSSLPFLALSFLFFYYISQSLVLALSSFSIQPIV